MFKSIWNKIVTLIKSAARKVNALADKVIGTNSVADWTKGGEDINEKSVKSESFKAKLLAGKFSTVNGNTTPALIDIFCDASNNNNQIANAAKFASVGLSAYNTVVQIALFGPIGLVTGLVTSMIGNAVFIGGARVATTINNANFVKKIEALV